MNAIEIKNLVKTYKNGTQAVKGVDLVVPQGDFFALLGANGAGKTTIISILIGLVNKTSGTVKVFDHNIDQEFDLAKRCIGVVPQEFNFNMFEKVHDIVSIQAGFFGIERKIAVKNTEEVLKKVGLWDKKNAMARTLSGGMKRRLMIARALVHKPRVLVLDEPTAGVDVQLRVGMWDYLRELNAQGVTILLTTHYLEEVQQMCRNAAIIKEGQIVRLDSVKNLNKFITQETYVIAVKTMESLAGLEAYKPVVVDDHTLEVELNRDEQLNGLLIKLINNKFDITDVHPKGQRLEKLFLSLL
ncbi:MAG: ABC transporter ATP-binding protein [Candidatus Omnitrophica bacterium]|nr:ABC transporter ATP-binding protein [Candidatus Omnitrophota bacterium]MBF0489712.1 ABC transporter ATP-binding protein [Candidatus Omnitrophota bacterium]